MLNRIIFNRCMSFILMTHEVQIDEEKNNAFYNLMKNDFTDDEFQKVCEHICKNEILYNKYPTPPLFYKQKATKEDKSKIQCQMFLEKVEDYLSLDFVPMDWKKDFIKSLTKTEGKVLQSFGGISVLWTDCHRDEKSRSLSNVLRDLKQCFMDTCKLEDKVDYLALEQKVDSVMVGNVNNLMLGLVRDKKGNLY